MQFYWAQRYGMIDEDGNDILHWALCDDESDKKRLVSCSSMVLFANYPKMANGQPLGEMPIPKRIVDLLNRYGLKDA